MMRGAGLLAVACCFVVACAVPQDGQMIGRAARRDGILVADLTPLVADAETMARQAQCPNSCNGHGVCVVQEGSPFPPSCTCFFLWSGLDCSIAQCPNNCSLAGTCDHTNGFCHCNEGMAGTDCSIDTRRGVCPNGCSGHGVCNNGICTCFEGWHGMDCAYAPCPNNCSRHGACLEWESSFGGASCVCEKGWGGKQCEKRVRECPTSNPEVCSGHGRCNQTTGLCACTKGFSGADCSQRDCVMGYLSRNGAFPPPFSGCPNDCSCHGYCFCDEAQDQSTNCYCACEPGWAGDSCAAPIPLTDPNDGIPQPFPDPEVYPHLHPYLSDDERAAIALKRQGMQPAPEPELLAAN